MTLPTLKHRIDTAEGSNVVQFKPQTLELPKLSAREAKALTAWAGTDPDMGVLHFHAIAKRSGLQQHCVRRTVRALARKGISVFHRGCFTDEGEVAGSGYGLTPLGRSALISAIQSEGHAHE